MTTSARRSDVVYGDQTKGERSRLGHAVGLVSSSPRVPCRRPLWAPMFTRILVKGSLGGEVYAFSEMMGHVALLRDFYAPLAHVSLGMVGLEDCGSPLTHPRNKRAIPGKVLARH